MSIPTSYVLLKSTSCEASLTASIRPSNLAIVSASSDSNSALSSFRNLLNTE